MEEIASQEQAQFALATIEDMRDVVPDKLHRFKTLGEGMQEYITQELRKF